MVGKQNSRRVSLCFLGRGPPMSNCIHNDQGVSVSITTPSLHKPASEKTELKSMNIASQSLCSSLYEPLCDLQLHNTHTRTHTSAFKVSTASRQDPILFIYPQKSPSFAYQAGSVCIINCCMQNMCLVGRIWDSCR